MSALKCKLAAFGAWGTGFESWQDLEGIFKGKDENTEMPSSPKPEVIPANERRRAPLPVKLAVESSWQATQNLGVDPKDLACVFVSGLGDTQLTDYMCKVLATENKQLSPTKFHNSVHNAAAGYWTISTDCMRSANSVAGYEHSVSLTLLEGVTQSLSENIPLLLTFFDAPVSEVLKGLLKNEMPFAFSIIIVPSDSKYEGIDIECSIDEQKVDWPKLAVKNKNLQTVYEMNPAAKVLALIENILAENSSQITMPLSEETSLKIGIKK